MKLTHKTIAPIEWRTHDPTNYPGESFVCFAGCGQQATMRTQLRISQEGQVDIPLNLCLCSTCVDLSPEELYERVTTNAKTE